MIVDGPFEVEYRLRAASGHYRWVLDRGAPAEGHVGGYVGGCLDIDSRVGERERQRLLAVVGARGPVPDDRSPGPLAQLTVGMRYVLASSLMRWLALAAILFSLLFFSLYLDLLPPSGYVGFLTNPWEWFTHLLMPAVTVGVVSGSILTRFMRSAMLEALGQDYTRTARSKGLRERLIVRRHVLRNAMVAFVTVAGLQLAYLLSGVVVVEQVFAWPGLGQLALNAVLARDYPVLQGAVMLFAFFFLLVNLVVDLLYAFLDPRIRY